MPTEGYKWVIQEDYTDEFNGDRLNSKMARSPSKMARSSTGSIYAWKCFSQGWYALAY